MKKWLRRLTLLAVLLIACAVGAAVMAYRAANARPAWYEPPAAQVVQAGPERTAAANRVLRDVAQANNALDQHQAEVAAGVAEEDEPAEPFELAVADADLNALLAEWSAVTDWEAALGGQLERPVVRLLGGRLVLAGRLPKQNVIAAVHVEPFAFEEDAGGGAGVRLARVTAGRLPLPVSFWRQWRDPLVKQLDKALPTLRDKATVERGVANDAAAQLVWAELLLTLLRGEPAGPDVLMYLPRKDGWLPVRVEAIAVGEGTATVTLRPLPPDAAAAMLTDAPEEEVAAAAE